MRHWRLRNGRARLRCDCSLLIPIVARCCSNASSHGIG